MNNLAKFMATAAICGGVMLSVAARADTIVLQNQNRDIVRQWV